VGTRSSEQQLERLKGELKVRRHVDKGKPGSGFGALFQERQIGEREAGSKSHRCGVRKLLVNEKEWPDRQEEKLNLENRKEKAGREVSLYDAECLSI